MATGGCGTAIARVLTGAVNPSGKLTQSWPRSVGHVGSGAAPWLQRVRGKWVSNRKSCDSATGRCFDSYTDAREPATPLFAFGFGLSYSSFAYSRLSLNTTVIGHCENVGVTVDVTNTGGMDGDAARVHALALAGTARTSRRRSARRSATT